MVTTSAPCLPNQTSASVINSTAPTPIVGCSINADKICQEAAAATREVSPDSSKQGSSAAAAASVGAVGAIVECPLCILQVPEQSIPSLVGCHHRVCLECMQRYIKNEINHSRLSITCPICPEPIQPNAIKRILNNEEFYQKYESFMLRRVLAAEPDARWCPAPDCGYVVLANGCASCPRLKCARVGCNTYFCYHCKQEWHPNQTCDAARVKRNRKLKNGATSNNEKDQTIGDASNQKSSPTSSGTTPSKKANNTSQSSSSSVPRGEDIKECPICGSRIIKMNDGSCNHMTCSICETEFCWLCLKEISDLHYFSPSGCTFWGKKPWSRKKKILWQLGLLAGAPVCILLVAGFAVPAIMIGVPVWVGRRLYNKLEKDPMSRRRKNAIITGGVLLSMCISPILSALALGIGVPVVLGYVYGVVPISLCRSGRCGMSPSQSLENLRRELDHVRSDVSSIGDKSVTNVEMELLNDGSSTRALAGSIISHQVSETQVPVEVHSPSPSKQES